jgi:hypothetical protein
MRGNINPFEPWRPVEARIPQPIHASRPWRPSPPPPARQAAEEPPFVLPVNTPRRDGPPAQPARTKQLQNRKERPSSGCIRISQFFALGIFFLLTVLCLDAVDWLRGTHLPRLIAIGASAGFLVAMALNGRRNWYTRLAWMAGALAFAGAAAWFVPTVNGVSLWSAYRQVEAIRNLPAGDLAAYRRGAEARQLLVEEFPSLAADISAAKQAWLRRTVDEAIESADKQLESDPHAAFVNLHRLNMELARLEHYDSVKKELESARRRAMQVCAKLVEHEVKKEEAGQH